METITQEQSTEKRGVSLLAGTQEMLGKSAAERIKYLREELFIPYTRAQEVLAKLDELLDEPVRSRMDSLLIVGDSNNGKTSLIRRFAQMHPPTDGYEDVDIAPGFPVLVTQAPYAPDVSAFFDRILNKLLVPFKHTDPASKKEFEVQYHFSRMSVRMLIVDEIHNVLSGSVSRQKTFMNALKNLSNELSIPIVLVGIQDALTAVSTDLQIGSRFVPELLPRWQLNRDYLSLLASIEAALPLKRPSNIATTKEIALEILDLSEGLIGEIVRIINEAGKLAIESGKERITLDLIKEIRFVKPSLRRTVSVLNSR